jgi:predicted DNA-binding protein with PD1-like motif
MKQVAGTAGPSHVLRLEPGEDVRELLEQWAKEKAIEGAAIISAVGSLTHAHIRYGGRADGIMTIGDLEICSLSGTLARHGVHLHLSIADRDGAMLGGHLLKGSLVRTTLELVIQEIAGVQLLRTHDEKTTYNELDPRLIKG